MACKWTTCSNRAQHFRHKNRNMPNHRRGRIPHSAAATTEPPPTWLASIARGTGEVDVTYRIGLDELRTALKKARKRTKGTLH
ncbi:NgoMIV family type II restriction endonuclease [Kineococcus indalonis]|uniref:NgoMIV family type II restriction endonuclease n=1 Tax=Kineococcus indalonis TaxID=2696566 RepID=UPI0038990412